MQFFDYSVLQTFRPWGSSSVTDVGFQGVFIYRHLFPPFSITSLVKTGHPIEWSQARVVEREENWHRRRIKEALKIQQYQV